MPKRVCEITLKEYLEKRHQELLNETLKYTEMSKECNDDACKLQYDLQYDIAKASLNEVNNIIALCEKRKRY